MIALYQLNLYSKSKICYFKFNEYMWDPSTLTYQSALWSSGHFFFHFARQTTVMTLLDQSGTFCHVLCYSEKLGPQYFKCNIC